MLRAVGGRLVYCDPDLFPVGRGNGLETARRRLPQIRANASAFRAILAYVGIPPGSKLSDRQIVAISDAYKQISAIQLRAQGVGFAFSVEVPGSSSASGVEEVDGTVSRTGSVRITSRHPGRRPNCPICLAKGDLVETPSGPVAVQEVRVGMAVWSADGQGARIRARVAAVGRTVVPLGHEVVRMTLADGRTLMASPGHPTIDGEPIGAFRVGDPFDGGIVSALAVVPYRAAFTYDLLASGPTGAYFVNGILLGSTLAPSRGLLTGRLGVR